MTSLTKFSMSQGSWFYKGKAKIGKTSNILSTSHRAWVFDVYCSVYWASIRLTQSPNRSSSTLIQTVFTVDWLIIHNIWLEWLYSLIAKIFCQFYIYTLTKHYIFCKHEFNSSCNWYPYRLVLSLRWSLTILFFMTDMIIQHHLSRYEMKVRFSFATIVRCISEVHSCRLCTVCFVS